MPPRIALVDAHAHAFRAFYALAPRLTPDGRPIHAVAGLTGLLITLLNDPTWDAIAVAFDAVSETRQTFRTALYPAYKAHRPPRPPALQAQLPLLRDATAALGLPILEHPSFEADDCIASTVALAEGAGCETTILSADKDLFQLVSAQTTVWDSARGIRYDPGQVATKLGVAPHQVADYLALVGDPVDHIPGVPGIGPRRAAALLRRWGSLETLLASLPIVPPRERHLLEQHQATVTLARKLTELRADVPLDLTLERLQPRPLARPEAAFFESLGLTYLVADCHPPPREVLTAAAPLVRDAPGPSAPAPAAAPAATTPPVVAPAADHEAPAADHEVQLSLFKS